MTRRILRMVGNAHIDPVWLWQWPEGMAEVRATFRSALDRMTEYPDFIFTAASAAHYEWIERIDPGMFEEIRVRVREGRWELAGGWWVEPDCNLPGGESLVRQALLGQRYFESRFGRTATVGYNVDSFGHPASLPGLLRGAGLGHYVFMRPQPHELELPGEVFWWEGIDGSRVLAARIPHEYCGPRGALDDYVATAVRKLDDLASGWNEALLFYGVGNHGGGPTRANIDSLHELDAAAADGNGRPRIVLSSPERYFAGLRAAIEGGDVDLPVWRADLQHHARGCYSAHAGVKRWDRAAERALVTAETLHASVGSLIGETEVGRRPDDEPPAPPAFEGAWRDVTFNEFHDILAGTAIEPAYDDARDAYGEALAIAGRATHAAFQRLARRIDIPVDPATKPIVVLNPHPWPTRSIVELETGGVADDDVLLDEDGRQLPLQRIQSLATASEWRRRYVFAIELPPLGYRTLRIATAERTAGTAAPEAQRLVATDMSLENEHLRLVIDRETGWITSLADRRGAAELVGEGLARALVIDDPSDTWSHGLVGYGEPIGRFEPRSIRLVETGPVRATIRVDGRFGESRLRLDVSLAAGARAVELRGTLDWRERRRLLKLRFGTGLVGPAAVATAGIAFGAIERPRDGSEEAAGPWADVSGRTATGAAAGLVVVNEAISGLDVRGSDLGLTLVRSPIYAHHDPRVPDEANEDFTYHDQGPRRFRLWLVPHAGDWRATAPARAAAELAQPPLSLLESFHAGPLPARGSLGAVEGEGVVASAFKRAEDGDATVLRLVETLGRDTPAQVRLAGGRELAVTLDPWSVRTFRLPDDGAREPQEVDLVERPLPSAPERQADHLADRLAHRALDR